MARQFDKLAFVASPTPEAKDAAAALGARYAHAPPEEAGIDQLGMDEDGRSWRQGVLSVR